MSSFRSLIRIFIALLLAGAGFALGLLLGRHGYFGEPMQVAELVDGGTYRGTVRAGRLQGQGSIEWPTGDRYDGHFQGGSMHGEGRFEDAYGNVYEGQFVDGMFTGHGTITSVDGSVYEGETDKWSMHGKGVYRLDETEYRGTFEEDVFTGEGEVWSDGELVYRGGFKEWSYHGEGEWLYEEQRYTGEFADGYLVSGTHHAANGDTYEGSFSYNQYDGSGVLQFADGDRYEGEFDWGEFDGAGTMYLAEPQHGFDQYSGTWRNGKLIESEQSVFVEDYRGDMERAVYREGDLLDGTLAEIATGNPDETELYFLGIAGDGTQRVFWREVAAVSDYFSARGADGPRSVRLINDRKQIGERPMATRTSVQRALRTLGDKMNTEQDVLVLYLSSHGSSSHQLSLKNAALSLRDMPADELAQYLRDSGIRWRIIFVSACYAGGFIEPLKSEYSLILTAAAADRTSFGCSDESQMTYFGRALLDALPEARDVDDLFAQLAAAVRAREEAEEREPSDPQMYLGSAMARRLEAGEIALFPQGD